MSFGIEPNAPRALARLPVGPRAPAYAPSSVPQSEDTDFETLIIVRKTKDNCRGNDPMGCFVSHFPDWLQPCRRLA
jgi:hypothetical protein